MNPESRAPALTITIIDAFNRLMRGARDNDIVAATVACRRLTSGRFGNHATALAGLQLVTDYLLNDPQAVERLNAPHDDDIHRLYGHEALDRVLARRTENPPG
jgi:hypothetical protein